MEKQRAALNKTALCIKEWIGVEPTNDGFADQSLTAWVPLRWFVQYIKKGSRCQPSPSLRAQRGNPLFLLLKSTFYGRILLLSVTTCFVSGDSLNSNVRVASQTGAVLYYGDSYSIFSRT